MASYDDLRSALDHIRQVTGDPNAWQKGLSEQQIRDVTGWLNSQGAAMTSTPTGYDYGGWRDPETGVYYENRIENTGGAPQVPDADLDRIRQAHPDLFDPSTRAPLAPAPAGPPATDPQHSPTAPGTPPGTAPNPAGAPPIPASADDDGFSGRAAEAAKRVDDALAKNTTALAEADEELVDAVLGAKTGSDEGKAQLQALQAALVDQIHKLGPTLDTPAGQQQLNDFLQGKTQEILGIVKSAGMDAESKAEVLDALSQRYDAVKDSAGAGGGSSDPAAGGGSGQTGGGTTGSAGAPAPADAGGGAGDPLAGDPLLSGLASDPLMAGLGALAGPAMGALSGLPGAMGSMMPAMGGFGGGGGLGDLGGAIGGAIKEAASARPPEDAVDAHEDDAQAANSETAEHGGADDEPDAATDEGAKDAPEAEPAAAKPAEAGGQPAPIAAETGQVPAAQPGPDVSVKLPDGSTVTADSPQLAQAGRLVLEGASLDDASGQAQVTVLPPGAPVNEPVSPSQLKLMDYAQFTDHRVMALGNGKVWLNGQVTPVEEMPTGPNFLGWARPQVQTAAAAPPATVLAGAH